MPRCENVGANVDQWYKETNGSAGSSIYDVCKDCAEILEADQHAFDEKLKPFNGDPQGEDGWQPGVDHPPYEGEEYSCACCGARLTEADE